MLVYTTGTVVGVERYCKVERGVRGDVLLRVGCCCTTARCCDIGNVDVAVAIVGGSKHTLHLATILANMPKVVTEIGELQDTIFALSVCRNRGEKQYYYNIYVFCEFHNTNILLFCDISNRLQKRFLGAKKCVFGVKIYFFQEKCIFL